VPAGTYAALSLRFAVEADTRAMADAFAHAYASCASELHDATSVVQFRSGDTARCVVRLDDGPEFEAADDVEGLIVAMAEIDRVTVEASAEELLILHAWCVHGAHGPVLFVGPSGAGKTTMAAAMLASGWTYAGDEAIGVDGAGRAVTPNPKPFKLDQGSRRALREFTGSTALAVDDPHAEVVISASALGPVGTREQLPGPAAVVQVVYTPGAPASLAALSRADVAELLAGQCFNFTRWGSRALDTVAAVARSAFGVRLTYSALPDACAVLEGVLA
jgi:hypothetical protein